MSTVCSCSSISESFVSQKVYSFSHIINWYRQTNIIPYNPQRFDVVSLYVLTSLTKISTLVEGSPLNKMLRMFTILCFKTDGKSTGLPKRHLQSPVNVTQTRCRKHSCNILWHWWILNALLRCNDTKCLRGNIFFRTITWSALWINGWPWLNNIFCKRR